MILWKIGGKSWNQRFKINWKLSWNQILFRTSSKFPWKQLPNRKIVKEIMESLKDLCVTKIHEITMDLLLKNDNLEIIPWTDRLDELPLSLKEDILEDAVTILVYPFKIRNIRYILRSSMGRYIRIMQMIMDRDQLEWMLFTFWIILYFLQSFSRKNTSKKKNYFHLVHFSSFC